MSTGIGQWAPVALFIYKRPDHARRMIASLQECIGYDESRVLVFADGPAHPRDLAAVRQTRDIARTMLGDRAVFLERETNLGVDRSIVAGVTQLCDRFGRVVVVEDDLVVSPLFLQFLNQGLQVFEGEHAVMQVSGHMFDVPELRDQRAALFLPLTTSWGWATWKRAWDLFDPTADGWRARLADARVRRRFDLEGHFAYSAMLKQQMRRDVGAWDIRWYYTVFARDGLTLFPPRTLVLNAGLEGSGTHHRLALPARQGALETAAAFDLPTQVEESTEKNCVFNAISAFRPSSPRRKLMALARVVSGRLFATFQVGNR